MRGYPSENTCPYSAALWRTRDVYEYECPNCGYRSGSATTERRCPVCGSPMWSTWYCPPLATKKVIVDYCPVCGYKEVREVPCLVTG